MTRGPLGGVRSRSRADAWAPATDPELMLFDEVTSALDPELVGEALDIICPTQQRTRDSLRRVLPA